MKFATLYDSTEKLQFYTVHKIQITFQEKEPTHCSEKHTLTFPQLFFFLSADVDVSYTGKLINDS